MNHAFMLKTSNYVNSSGRDFLPLSRFSRGDFYYHSQSQLAKQQIANKFQYLRSKSQILSRTFGYLKLSIVIIWNFGFGNWNLLTIGWRINLSNISL